MGTVDKKRKAGVEGQQRCKLQYFFSENRNNCVCLIYQETVAVCKEFNIKSHHQIMHANAY